MPRLWRLAAVVVGVCFTTWVAFHADNSDNASWLHRLYFFLQFCMFSQCVVSLLIEAKRLRA